LHPTRDFSFVRDTVNGFVLMAETDASIGEIIHTGSNFEVAIGETAELIAELMGAQIEIRSDDSRLRPAGSEVERLYADAGKAKRILGWTPEFGGKEGFKQGLKETIDWFSNTDLAQKYKPHMYHV